MKSKLFLFIIPFILLTCNGRPSVMNETVNIITYNIKNCNGLDGHTDYKRISEIISRAGADFAAIQELDSATARSKGVFVLDTLAKLTGMHGVFGASISFQGGKYGIGILSKEKPLWSKRIPLPGREEQRSMLLVGFENIIIGCTHFSLTAEDRLESVKVIKESIKDQSKPVFLAGDLNAIPSSAVLNDLSADWKMLNDTSMYTIPADNTRRCIDYILGLKSDKHEIVSRRAVVINEPVASDHRPVNVIAEIRNLR